MALEITSYLVSTNWLKHWTSLYLYISQEITDIKLEFTKTLTQDVVFSCFMSDTDNSNLETSSPVTLDVVGKC